MVTMRATGVGTGWIGLAVALALGAGCTLIIGVDAGHERMTTGTGGSTSSSGATGGARHADVWAEPDARGRLRRASAPGAHG